MIFYPAGLSIRAAGEDSRDTQVCWSLELYRTIAPELLHDAAKCRDPQECDRITRKALALLDHAPRAVTRRSARRGQDMHAPYD